jgi:hypothetical protein
MQVELLPSNVLAWDLYRQARYPDQVGAVIRGLRPLELNEFDADVLAIKVETLALEVAAMQEAERKRIENENRGR